MKKIAFVINTIQDNGPSNVVLGLIRNLDRTRYLPTLITLFVGNDDAIVASLHEIGVEVIACEHDSRLRYLLGGKSEFAQIVRKGQYDILHTHGFVPDVMASGIRTDAQRICTIHNVMSEDYLYQYGRCRSKLYTWLHRRALKKLDVCVGCSQTVADAMRKDVEHVRCVHNGSESKPITSGITRGQLNIPDDATVYVYVGGVNARKNVLWLVEQFSAHRGDQEYLLIVGGGPDSDACRRIGDSHVIMVGFQKDSMAYMHISDVYVSASKSEGFSISALEALECGLPLFVSKIPQHTELFEIAQPLYLGEQFDASDFAAQLAQLRDHLHTVDRQSIMACKQRHFSNAVMAKKYMALYQA